MEVERPGTASPAGGASVRLVRVLSEVAQQSGQARFGHTDDAVPGPVVEVKSVAVVTQIHPHGNTTPGTSPDRS